MRTRVGRMNLWGVRCVCSTSTARVPSSSPVLRCHLLIRARVDIRPIAERPAWSGLIRWVLGAGRRSDFRRTSDACPPRSHRALRRWRRLPRMLSSRMPDTLACRGSLALASFGLSAHCSRDVCFCTQRIEIGTSSGHFGHTRRALDPHVLCTEVSFREITVVTPAY